VIVAVLAASRGRGWFAVRCPVCNELVVALLGVSGATSEFEAAQPVLGALGVALAITALIVALARHAPRSAAAERTRSPARALADRRSRARRF
jgi:hypothetical protein